MPGPAARPGLQSVPAGAVWSTAILDLLNAPKTAQNYLFLNQWELREHGSLTSIFANNPFFTTAGGSGTVGPIKAGTYPLIPDSAFGGGKNTAGVPAYPDLATGVYANAYHISTQYPVIAAAIRSGNPASYAGNSDFQKELTSWSGGGYSGFASINAPAAPVGPTIGSGVSSALPGSAGGLSGVAGDVNSAARHIPGVAQVEGVAGDVSSVGDFLGRVTNPSYILRGLQIAAGGVLVLVGTVLLARQVGLAADLPNPVRTAPGVAAAAAVE